ncbi:TPA: chorismate-binding protein [Candidatus Gracilibacteria bacterium]|nr:chorismate-binding protein [Candidatus Gracilibacteria bacterium]HIQ57496.1 chorismate-binding protein [Candidatus Gracilibacteria bacterium]
MNLQEIRKKIDGVDTRIFHCIIERLQLVEEVVKWKDANNMSIYDAEREKELISEKRNMATEFGISPDTAEEIFRAIIAESHLQEKKFLQSDITSPLKIRRRSIQNHVDLLDIFSLISKKYKNFFFLESLGDDEWNHSSYLGFSPKKIFAIKDFEVFIDGVSQGKKTDPFSWLEEQFAPYQNLVANTKENGFVGGLVGHINFEAVKYTEKSLNLESHSGFFDVEFGLYLDGLIYNRKTEELEYIFTEEDRFEEVLDVLNTQKIENSEETNMSKILKKSVSFSDKKMDEYIEECKKEIYAGNVFQIVPSRKFNYEIIRGKKEEENNNFEVDVYKKLRETNPSPNMFFINFEDRKIIGSSPEMITKIQGKRIETYPIAGTRSRGNTPQEDAKLSAKMLSDEKEVAEHLMLVDMARNDLGKVCEYGSVKVEEIMALKKYSHVQHMVSRVAGKIKPNISSLQAALSNFPMGTVVGSPRIEALKILQKHEKELRGPYAGGIGYWSITGDMQLSLAIRSLFIHKNSAFAQAGAGVVFDSIARFEREEIEKKAKNIIGLL